MWQREFVKETQRKRPLQPALGEEDEDVRFELFVCVSLQLVSASLLRQSVCVC